MRDPSRIDRFCARLAKAWAKVPDWRFGQLISNALKYTPAGKITIHLEEPCTLCVEDTGIGIASEDLPRIFDQGFTGHNGRTDKRASGLGLYLCRRICRNLGHSIAVESEPGKGTVVKLDLSRKKIVTE